MKKIDAHAHIGYIGGWANVGINEEELIRQMDWSRTLLEFEKKEKLKNRAALSVVVGVIGFG